MTYLTDLLLEIAIVEEVQRLLTLGKEGYKIYIDKLAEKEQEDDTETVQVA